MAIPPELVGELTKRGHIRKNWKRRRFLLHSDGRLEYQTLRHVQKGNIYLEHYTVKQVSSADIREAKKFNIIHLVPQTFRGKDYFLCGDSKGETFKWYKALRFASCESKKRAKLDQIELKNPKPMKRDLWKQKAHHPQSRSNSGTLHNGLSDTSFLIRKFRTSSHPNTESGLVQGRMMEERYAVIMGSPLSPLVTRLFLDKGYKVKLISLEETHNNAPFCSTDLINETEGVFPITDDIMESCKSVLLPHSIHLFSHLCNFCLLRSVKKYSAHVVKVSFLGHIETVYSKVENESLKCFLQTEHIPSVFLFPSLPYEFLPYLCKKIDLVGKSIPCIALKDVAEACLCLMEDINCATTITTTSNPITHSIFGDHVILESNIQESGGMASFFAEHSSSILPVLEAVQSDILKTEKNSLTHIIHRDALLYTKWKECAKERPKFV